MFVRISVSVSILCVSFLDQMKDERDLKFGAVFAKNLAGTRCDHSELQRTFHSSYIQQFFFQYQEAAPGFGSCII